jgi:hypothetical protein
MYARRAAAVALVVVGMLASGAHATGSSTLDGTRRTRFSYQGELSESTLVTGEASTSPERAVEPTPADCTRGSCDISRVRLTVPRGRQSGQLDYEALLSDPVTGAPSTTSVASAALYDSKGKQVLRSSLCCGLDALRLSHPRLPAGSYTVVIYNQGQPTHFEATLTWVANPPHRTH